MAVESFKGPKPARIVVARWWLGDQLFSIERENRVEWYMGQVNFLRLSSMYKAAPGPASTDPDPYGQRDIPGLFGVEVYEEEQPSGEVWMGLLGQPKMLKWVDPKRVSPWIAEILPELIRRADEGAA